MSATFTFTGGQSSGNLNFIISGFSNPVLGKINALNVKDSSNRDVYRSTWEFLFDHTIKEDAKKDIKEDAFKQTKISHCLLFRGPTYRSISFLCLDQRLI
jgi:hypothetical protein